MRLFTICSRLEYEKNGEKHHRWFSVGELIINESGKMHMRLYQLPETRFYLFDKEETLPSVDADTNKELPE